MKIIVTGASGFIGKNLSSYLQQKGMPVSKVSLRDPIWKKCFQENAGAVIHLAGKAHDTKSTSAKSEYLAINRDLTISVFNEYLKSNISDFFFFSSVKAVADHVEGTLKENIVANPQTPYGRSKFEAEQYLLKVKLTPGKRLFIIRPCMIHGPGNKGNLNLLYKIVRIGIPWPLAAFENKRSFLSIENLSFLIFELLLNKDVPSGIYNFSDDESLSTNQLITLMNKVRGKKARLFNLNKKLIITMASVGEKFHLPFNRERLNKLTENYIVSNSKIKAALNIEKLPRTAEAGIIKTIESFNKRNSDSIF